MINIDLQSIALNRNVFKCNHIKWSEVLYLPKWCTYAFPDTNELINNMIHICQKLEQIRFILGAVPVYITSGYRPELYNKLIGGSIRSQHIFCNALDFKHSKKPAVEVRAILQPKLNDLGIRMENHRGNWTHIDMGPVGKSGRYFKP